MKTMTESILDRLVQHLGATRVEVEDQSARHVGHPGAADGGHYHVLVVSPAFAGKGAVERHRMVFAALAGQLEAMHALSITAHAPGE